MSPPWVACEHQHLLGFTISQWVSECPADSSPIPLPVAPSPRYHMCAFWSMSYSRSDAFVQMSGHILILFIGEEGWSLVPGEAGGHRVHRHSHVSDQSRQERSWLPLEIDVTIRLVVSWFWKTETRTTLYCVYFLLLGYNCLLQKTIMRQNVFLGTYSLSLCTPKVEMSTLSQMLFCVLTVSL